MPHLSCTFIAIFLTLVPLTGCNIQRNAQLEAVARDWCLTIRASQVIPVYPLTEDLQPGDVFLVQTSVDEQHKEYKKLGFLRFDNHIHRIDSTRYSSFYKRSFGNDAPLRLPHDWLSTAEPSKAWLKAPDAAFPSYGFSIREGGGFNMALPIQGIPVGLSFMGTNAADGSIIISKASTYGVDIVALDDEVRAWAKDKKTFLMNYAPTPQSTLAGPKMRVQYLRVVYRIYLTKQLDVSLADARTGSFGADVGAAKKVDLLTPITNTDPTKVTGEAYRTHLTQLNASLADSLKTVGPVNELLPGGSLRIVAASAGHITLKQEFDRPLVIGYLGFDLPILDGGELGAPIPTYAVLNGMTPEVPLSFDVDQAKLRAYTTAIRQMTDSTQVRNLIMTDLGGEYEAIYLNTKDEMKKDVFFHLLGLAAAEHKSGTREKLINSLKLHVH